MGEYKVTKTVAESVRDSVTRKLANLRLPTPQPMLRLPTDEEQAEAERIERELSGTNINLNHVTVKDILSSNPLPENIDPFSRALLSGCDPVSVHQAMTLAMPILSFLGQNIRVLYGDGTLRWISGQSWQMGGSGCGKSVVLRALERLFLSRELRRNAENAKEIAAYSMLSEKERKEKPSPEVEVRVMDCIPTALALLQQIQVNKGGVIYISCSECGEFAKKIGNPYYSLVLDMLKKSYDGTGEPFMHKASDRMYYAPSMKLCFNVGGTVDPMFRIFRHCNADGTLSRGSLTILAERKDEKTEGVYRAPQWTEEQEALLWAGAERLRNTNNTFYEKEDIDSSAECMSLLEKYGYRKDDQVPPTMEELEKAVARERCSRAFSLPQVLALGRDIKAYVASLGDVAADCCSRADERAMGLCYLLLVANGYRFGADGTASDAAAEENAVLMEGVLSVVRWWVMTTIDCAWAVQTRINAKYISERRGIVHDTGEAATRRIGGEVNAARKKAFEDFEARHAGEDVNWEALREEEAFAPLSRTTIWRLISERGWEHLSRGLYRLPYMEEKALSA